MRRQKWHQKMRTRVAGALGEVWPETAQLLINHLRNHCQMRGLVNLKFAIDGLPISLNHMYEKGFGSEYCKEGEPGAWLDKDGRWRKRADKERSKLRQEAIDWRRVVAEAMGEDRWKWKPSGVTAAVILFETPHWLTYKRQVREMDADNKLKPALDAVQNATDIPDELHWQLHVFKVLSKRQRTTIFLYDLGDVVEYYY